MTQSEVKTNPGKELQQFVAEFYDKYAAKYGFIGNYFNPEYASDCIDLEQETDLDISSNYVASIDQKKQVDHYQLIVLTIPQKGNTFTISLVTRATIDGESDDMLDGYGSPYTNSEPDKILEKETKTLSGNREETLQTLSDLAQ